jgi:hypothetical protein
MVNRASTSLGPSWSKSCRQPGRVRATEKVLQPPSETLVGTVVKHSEKEVMNGPINLTALRRSSPGADPPEVPLSNP